MAASTVWRPSVCPIGIVTLTHQGQHATRPAYISDRRIRTTKSDQLAFSRIKSYDTAWNIRLNPTKSQLITFGGPHPSVCGIHINGKRMHLVNKIKYLVVYLLCNKVLLISQTQLRKFYGKFNNIMAVLSKHSNEMTTLHLVKSYCLPALLYGCKVWHLNDSNMQKNISSMEQLIQTFFFISVKPLQYFCHTLPIPYLLLHQRKLLFWKKLYQAFVAVGSLHNVLSPKLSYNSVRELIWNSFAMSVDLWFESYYFLVVLCF